MSIEVTSFPITEAASFYSNVFRGFVKENIELKFEDESSCDVINAGGFVKLENFTDVSPTPVLEEKEIVIIGGDYQPALGLITGVDVLPDTITTDIPFVSTGKVRFFIKYPNLRMSYRFTEFTTQDDQSATNLFDTDFTFYANNFGVLLIDISLISSLMKPSFDFTNELNTDMGKVFQVQYKPLYDGSSDTWVSAHDSGLTAFVPFISIHAGGRVAKVIWSLIKLSPDFDLVTRIWRGYKKIFSVFSANDNLLFGNLLISIVEYTNAKVFIKTNNLYAALVNGLVNITVPTLDNTTRYIALVATDGGATSSINYITVYDTLQDETEFYLTWASENGTIRNWLFTSKIEFDNRVKQDVLRDSEFRGIPNQYNEKLLLQAKGLSKIEKDYLNDIYLSNKILLLNDGNEFECVISKTSFNFENRSNSYICTIEVQKKQRNLMNV